jgi:hypothetical protein
VNHYDPEEQRCPLPSIIVLAVRFLLATVLPLNMDALALCRCLPAGLRGAGMSTNDILADFPGSR